MEFISAGLYEELVKWRDCEIKKGNMNKARLIQMVISRRKNGRIKSCARSKGI